MVDVNLTARGNRYFRLRAPGVALTEVPLSQHNSVDGAYEAAVKHAARNGIDGIYTIQPPDGWEVETMGFRIATSPPPPSAGQVWIQSNPVSVVEHQQLSFTVQRGAGSAGAIAVDWSMAIAQGSPSPASGTVNFANGDMAPKTVNVQMGNVTATVSGTVTLNNPRSTSGGGTPVISTAVLNVTVTNDTTAPAAVTLGATASSSTVIALTFAGGVDVGSGFAEYVIERSPNGTSGWVEVARPTTPGSLDDTGRTASTQYHYRLSALDRAGNRSAYATASVTTQGTSPGTPSASWLQRSTGPGVVWVHPFSQDAEVNAFRWTGQYGNDPLAIGRANAGNVRRLVGQGPDGMDCLEILRPAGTSETAHWWRPLSPIAGAGNGRGVDDPAAGGSIALVPYLATDGGSQTQNFPDRGFYGHASLHTGNVFDGDEFYLQMRVKMDPRRAQAGMPQGGKLQYLTRTDLSLTTQEIVTYSGGQVGSNPTQNNFQMYGGGDSNPLYGKAVGAGGTNDRQPGSELGMCNPGVLPNLCWAWSGGWDTVLYRLRPGRPGQPESLIQVLVAREGETEYTVIWDMLWANAYGSGHPFGYNALILSAYNNNLNCPSEFWHRYAQLIFSKQFIPCPRPPATATAFETAALLLAPGQNTVVIGSGSDNGNTGFDAASDEGVQWVNRHFYDHDRGIGIVHGKLPTAGSPSGPAGSRTHALYNALTNSYACSGYFHIGSQEGGHVYESFGYAPEHGEVLVGRWNTNPTIFQRWLVGDPLTTWDQPFTAPWAMSMTNGHQPVLVWHPNLFGAGDGGWIGPRMAGGANIWIVARRRNGGTWHTLVTTTATGSNPHLGAGVYVRSGNYVLFTLATGQTWTIGQGAGGVAATPVQIANPPIPCQHAGGGTTNRGILLDDPTGLGAPYVLQKAGSNLVYRYIGGAWPEQPYTHPFPDGAPVTDTNWSVASCYPLGIFWSVRSNLVRTNRLWRPG